MGIHGTPTVGVTMVGSMPYSLEKGPYFSVLEDYVNGSRQRARSALEELRAGAPIATIGALDSKTLDAGPYDTAALVAHLNTDWFGFQQVGGAWAPQDPYDPKTNPTTGFWVGWYGDCEAIFRETLIRACELSLGLDHGESAPMRITQHWPIELFWRCPVPWFEGWVTWRRAPSSAAGGQVTVIVSTPGHGHPLVNTPLRKASPPPAGYQQDPTSAPGSQGMWVVSQSYHRPRPAVLSAESGLGEWTFPTVGLAFTSEGDVVVVAPPEHEGGVLDPPRKWDPH